MLPGSPVLLTTMLRMQWYRIGYEFRQTDKTDAPKHGCKTRREI